MDINTLRFNAIKWWSTGQHWKISLTAAVIRQRFQNSFEPYIKSNSRFVAKLDQIMLLSASSSSSLHFFCHHLITQSPSQRHTALRKSNIQPPFVCVTVGVEDVAQVLHNKVKFWLTHLVPVLVVDKCCSFADLIFFFFVGWLVCWVRCSYHLLWLLGLGSWLNHSRLFFMGEVWTSRLLFDRVGCRPPILRYACSTFSWL